MLENRLHEKRTDIVFYFLTLAFLLLFTLPTISKGVENIRMIRAFVPGEADIDVEWIKRILIDRNLHPLLFAYGSVYYYLSSLLMLPYKLFLPLTDSFIIIALRTISISFGLLSVIALYFSIKKVFDAKTAVLGSLVLMMTPIFYIYSTMSRCDIMNMFFIVICIRFCFLLVQRYSHKRLIFASIFAGLSFGTKYTGVFLLPTVLVASLVGISRTETSSSNVPTRFLYSGLLALGMFLILVSMISSEGLIARLFTVDGSIDDNELLGLLNSIRLFMFVSGCYSAVLAILNMKYHFFERQLLLKRIFLSSAVMLFVFAVTFVITNPYAIIDLPVFLKVFRAHIILVSTGDLFREDPNSLLWFSILSSRSLIGPFNLLLLLFYASVCILNLKKGIHSVHDSFIIALWCASFFGYLFFKVNFRQPVYLLPILPFVCMFVSRAFFSLYETDFSRRFVSYVIKLVLVIGMATFFASSIQDDLRLREDYANRPNSIIVRAGNWLKDNFPPEYRITYDHYSYVPPKFKHAFPSWRQTEVFVREKDPDLIVVSEEISRRYAEEAKASQYIRYIGDQWDSESPRREEYLNIHSFYDRLKNGTFLPYVPIRDFGSIKVFGKKDLKERSSLMNEGSGEK